MTSVKITFFKSMDIHSKARSLDMIGRDIPQIVSQAAHHMKSDEGFACFTAPDGQVVALDRNSQFVMV